MNCVSLVKVKVELKVKVKLHLKLELKLELIECTAVVECSAKEQW